MRLGDAEEEWREGERESTGLWLLKDKEKEKKAAREDAMIRVGGFGGEKEDKVKIKRLWSS